MQCLQNVRKVNKSATREAHDVGTFAARQNVSKKAHTHTHQHTRVLFTAYMYMCISVARFIIIIIPIHLQSQHVNNNVLCEKCFSREKVA